jgi:xanthosine utilization system XapX-like protein
VSETQGQSSPEGTAAEPAASTAHDEATHPVITGTGTGTGPARGVRVLAQDEFSVADAVGGVRGMVESALPGLVFVVVFLVTRELVPALVASAGLAVVAVLVRLVQRTPPTQAFSGLVGVAIGVVWAWRTGDAENFFAWGLWVNLLWCLGALVSVLVGRPAVGLIVSLLRAEPMTWRTDPAHEGLRRRYVWATWLWVGVFGARLAVQLPLYLQGTEAVGWLGTAKLVMGVPLFALGLWLTWLLVASPAARAAHPGPPRTPTR